MRPLLLPLLVLCSACIIDPREDDPPPIVDVDAGITDTGYPAPRADLFPRVGSESSLDIATWNIENFPASGTTASLVADFVTSMDLDLIAVQEIADETAWQELVDRLPDHEGELSTHTYFDGSFQKVGFLYKTSVLRISDVRLIFQGASFEFPRPPISAQFTTLDGSFDFTAIAIHLKAGTDTEDRERRTAAIALLEDHLRDSVNGAADEDIVLLGDFNEVLTNTQARAVFAPLFDAGRYTVQTDSLPASSTSFIPAEITLDHIVTTISLADEIGSQQASIPELDRSIGSFDVVVSDHLPVVLSLPIF